MKESILLIFLFLSTLATDAQKLKKAERAIINELRTTVLFLSDDQLEGRRTGTQGERLAADYIVKRLEEASIQPKGDNGTYLQRFTINEGRQILPATQLSIDKKNLDSASYLPLTFSADGRITSMVAPAIQEYGEPWFSDISFLLSQNKNNPHFMLEEELRAMAVGFQKKGATAVLFYSSGDQNPELHFDGRSKQDRLTIPVVYIRSSAASKLLSAKENFFNIDLKIETGDKVREGHNVIGYIDNGAAHTIVIGAHYDHLGYGEDKNSLWSGAPQIHNGADDNASGTAVVIETARMLSKSNLKNNNYLFILFSGEELGLYGSKYFTGHPTIPLSSINYMINLDMVGRLNEQTQAITIGGYGTSPQWASLPQNTKYLQAKFDSSGIGPSDHTSFYLKDIPVLFFFTGTHADYHKPTDDADKINYTGQLRILQYIMDLIKNTNNAGKLAFTKTREPDMGQSPRFSVSLGVMPDYTYDGKGLRIDGVINGKTADMAGMKAGDIITQIGEYQVTDINDYMLALSKFKKGDQTTVEFTQDKQNRSASITF